MGPDEVAISVRLLSYTADTAALLPLLITTAVESGNLVPLAAQALMVQKSLSGSMASGMHNAVVCTEDAPFYSELDIDRGAMAERTYLGTSQLELLETMCAVWPRGILDDDLRSPLRLDVPALLLSGDVDPITPPGYAVDAVTGFNPARHESVAGQGHGQIAVPCVGDLIAEFFTTGDPAALDFGCTDLAVPAPFFLSFSGPAP